MKYNHYRKKVECFKRKFTWIPNHSVGPFIFGEKITKYEKYRINYYSLYSRVTPFMGYYWFKSFEELYIFHSSDQNDNRLIIDSIHSTKLYYKGQNLLKMNIQDVVRLLGKPNTIDGWICRTILIKQYMILTSFVHKYIQFQILSLMLLHGKGSEYIIR